MDLQKLANLSQILGLVPGVYCAYGVWVTLHPTTPEPNAGGGVIPAGILIAFGAFVALMLLGLILRLFVTEPDPAKLIIHYARYGKGRWIWQYQNVTKIVRSHIKSGNSLDLILGHQSFGDPFYGTPKYTTIKYSFGGVTRIRIWQEGHRLVISPTDVDLDWQIARKREWRNKAEELQRELDQLRQSRAVGAATNPAQTIGDPSLTLDYSQDAGFRLLNPSGTDAVNVVVPRILQGRFWVDWDYPTTLPRGASQAVPISLKDSSTGEVLAQDPAGVIEMGWRDQISTVGDRRGVELVFETYIEYGLRSGAVFKSYWEIKYDLGTKKISVRFIRDEPVHVSEVTATVPPV